MKDVSLIHREIVRSLSPVNTADSALFVGTHNAAYGNAEKAVLFGPVYREFVGSHHLLAWQEVDGEFLRLVSKSVPGYSYYCTPPNSRGQAVGFTIQDRLQVVESVVYEQVRLIDNVPDLRPVLRLDLVDQMTGLRFSATVVHYKSNYGGSRAASPIRRVQAKAHVDAMKIQNEFVISLGDYNQVLGTSTDVDALCLAGFKLIPAHDQACTHASGERLDGMFAKNIPRDIRISCYKPRNFWRNSNIGLALSDHALVTWMISPRHRESAGRAI